MNVALTEPTVPAWFKSSYSSGEGGQCVEIAASTDAVHIRDSKTHAGPVLTVTPAAWAGFVELAARHTV
ncbi:DUF397 domain-containing protein [Streptomyces sp. A5-4]|uniref:DUF397 domain-containing protein n=1 Tax=Streptomyces sp. A5-4 TaxID=3384771 RepID=UPI003DA98297